MLEKIKFINHMNEAMDWGSNGIFVNQNDLRNYSWDYTKENNKISAFSQSIVKKSVPIVIACQSEDEGVAIKNKLFEICEKDVLATQHGRLIVGDYYLKCFISGSSKSEYLYHKGYLKVTLTIVTDYPQWIKESTVTFRTAEDSVAQEGAKRNLDFNVDFAYNYASELYGNTLNNAGFVGTNFRLIIYGACTNPTIYIAGHRYQVNRIVEANEYLTIDSVEKTITLTKRNGEIVNCFNFRDRDSYIFEKIPSGSNVVSWNGYFGFDIVLIEERSEPKWT